MIVHLVLLRLRPGIPANEVLAFAKSVAGACKAMPSVEAAWVGPRVDIEAGYGRSFGDSTYDYAAILQFRGRSELLAYLQHPLHADVGRQFWQVCEATVVFEGELFDLKSGNGLDSWLINQQSRAVEQ
jgi:hypothetical protein